MAQKRYKKWGEYKTKTEAKKFAKKYKSPIVETKILPIKARGSKVGAKRIYGLYYRIKNK